MTTLKPTSNASIKGNDLLQYAETLTANPLSLGPDPLESTAVIIEANSKGDLERDACLAAEFVSEDPTSETIKILVGPLHEIFTLQRVRICSISPYFATTFASASTLQIVFPDIEPSTFQHAIDWLHDGVFRPITNQEIGLDKLIDIYLFGDLIGCHHLKNYTMDLIQDNMYVAVRRGSPGIRLSINQIRKIFAGTSSAEEAPIRTFVAALVSYRLIFGDKPERLEPIFEVPGFLKDFATFQRSSLKETEGAWYTPVSLREDPRVRGFRDVGVTRKGFHICSFHVHGKGDICSSAANNESVSGNTTDHESSEHGCLEQEEAEDEGGAVSANGEILR